MFAGITEVAAKQESRFLEPGELVAQIVAIRYGRTKKTDRPYFVVEMKVVTSETPGFSPGDLVVWMTQLQKYKNYFLQDVKSFVSSATGHLPDEVTEEVVELVAGEGQPLVGQGLHVRTWSDTNKTSGKSFKKSAFRRVDLDAMGHVPAVAESTDRFGPGADEKGGAGVVAIQKADIPDFRRSLSEDIRNEEEEGEIADSLFEPEPYAPDIGDGENMY